MIGDLTRAQRKRLGITQEELAERTGLSVRAIRAVETGRSNTPRAATIRLLADAFGLSGPEREYFYTAPPGPGDQPRTATRVPHQLPRALAGLVGREQDLSRLDAWLEAEASPLVVISGTAGVGKSALAVAWAHRVARGFPDGQLFVNLGGFGPPCSRGCPEAALVGFLHAMGVPAHQIPEGFPQQTALYRSVLAHRRVLVVVDNAREARHVRPLIPAAEGCLVIVTSRHQLTSLVVTDGATPVALDLLTVDGARQLLTQRLGQQRVAREPAAVNELITLCSRLPLALAVVAGRAATCPESSLSRFARQLRNASARLDALDGGDAVSDARTVFSWSYRPLGPEAARLFRLLGLYPGQDLSELAASALAGIGPARAVSLLQELTRAGLVTEGQPGRYSLHDLMRGYAMELSEQVDPPDQRRSALHRLLCHLLRESATPPPSEGEGAPLLVRPCPDVPQDGGVP